MLTSDGMTRDQFLPLWREAMWHATNVEQRARLALEYGRLEVRENKSVEPTLVVTVPDGDDPIVLMTLRDVPMALGADETDALRTKLAELASTEVYTIVALKAGAKDGAPSYLLVSWGESVSGEQSCWLQPFRWTHEGLEEAQAMVTPDPGATELSKHLAGLLTPRH